MRLEPSHPRRAPWEPQTDGELICSASLIDGVGKEAEIPLRAAALSSIKRWHPEITFYTDGSATANMTDGASAVIVSKGDPESPEVIEKLRQRGARFACSFDAELVALTMASEWLETKAIPGVVCICTDSQAVIKAIENTGSKRDEALSLNKRLRRIGARTVLQWVTGHVGLPGNELADAEAKIATTEVLPLPSLLRGGQSQGASFFISSSIP
jgi:ribonuclease HI